MEAIARNPKNGNMKYNARLLEEYDRKLADQAKDLPPGHGSRLDDLMDSIRTATESHRLTGLVGSWAGRRFLTPRHSANESGPVGSSTSAQAVSDCATRARIEAEPRLQAQSIHA